MLRREFGIHPPGKWGAPPHFLALPTCSDSLLQVQTSNAAEKKVDNIFKSLNKLKEKPQLGDKVQLTLPINEETFQKIKKRSELFLEYLSLSIDIVGSVWRAEAPCWTCWISVSTKLPSRTVPAFPCWLPTPRPTKSSRNCSSPG